MVKDNEIAITMDGRGRVQDNIFIERLWWTLKYHYIYFHAFGSGSELRHGLRQRVEFYNQALDALTPDVVHYDLPHPLATVA